jgi:hypothetical protein
MTIFKSFISLIVFAPLFVAAQPKEATISGSAPEWAGREIRLLRITDPISRTEEQLSSIVIAADGSFNLAVKIENTECFHLSVNRYSAPVCIDPGQKLRIELLPNELNKLVDTWQKVNFEYAYLDLDSTSNAALMAKIDQSYYGFYNDNALLVGTRSLRQKVLEYEKANANRYAGNAFMDTYMKYTIAEMKLSNAMPKVDLYEAYLKNSALSIQNPSFYAFFDLFYASYFNAYDSRFGGKTIYNHLTEGISFARLDSLLLKDQFLEREDIRQLVVLKSVAEVYTDKRYPRAALLSITRILTANPSPTFIGDVARRLSDRIERSAAIVSLFDLGLDIDHDKFKTSEQSSSTPVYLAITAPWSTESLKEMQLLEGLFGKYPLDFRIVEVSLAREGIASPPAPWIQAKALDVRKFMESLDVYSIPGFAWFDKDGNLTVRDAVKPGSGLENELFKLKTQREEKNKIKVGQ